MQPSDYYIFVFIYYTLINIITTANGAKNYTAIVINYKILSPKMCHIVNNLKIHEKIVNPQKKFYWFV